jgi:hypothetical protein
LHDAEDLQEHQFSNAKRRLASDGGGSTKSCVDLDRKVHLELEHEQVEASVVDRYDLFDVQSTLLQNSDREQSSLSLYRL